jgi:DNA-binding MarR family transcriptional regulator
MINMKVNAQNVCEDFMQLINKFKMCMNQIAEEYGLTMVQAHALYILSERGSIPMGRVADELHCDASNVTGIVDRLVSQQLVARTDDPTDRRTKRLVITPAGVQVVKKFFSRLPQALGITTLDKTEQQTLHDITRKLLI